MARHIMDLRLALDLMSRPDPGDPWWTPALRLGANTPDPIRVAVSIDPTGAGGYSSVAAGIRRAATILSDAGYAIKKIDPPRVADLPYIIKCLSNVVIKSYLPEILPNYIPGCPERSGRSYKG
jgi:Asp-tRNA(Asn)/Glu-tRNA(Gln) amidotransferase A subunit family amidase